MTSKYGPQILKHRSMALPLSSYNLAEQSTCGVLLYKLRPLVPYHSINLLYAGEVNAEPEPCPS